MNKKEKVIFLTNIKGIAKKGEIREVKEAFAKNFLLPEGKALIYNRATSTQFQYQEAKLEKEKALRRSEEEKTFVNIREKKLNFFLKEKDGQVFGSVTAFDIIRFLKEKFDIQISKKELPNFRPLHGKGKFFIEVKIGKSLITKLQITIDSF